MPRINQKAEQYANEDFRREVRIRQGYYDLMSQQALADAVDMPRPTLRKRMQEPETMTIGELRKLIKVIKPDPRILLLLIGYTPKDLRRAEKESTYGNGESGS